MTTTTSLLPWLQSHGATFPHLSYPHITSVGRGTIAIHDIPPKQVLLTVPDQCVITPQKAKMGLGIPQHREQTHLVGSGDGDDGMDDQLVLAAYLALEATKGKESEWFPYIASLPTIEETKAYNVHLWQDDDFEELQDGDDIKNAVKERFMLLQRNFTMIVSRLPAIKKVGNTVTFEWYAWGDFMVSSRAFGKRLDFMCLVPLADALNHDNVQTKYALEAGQFSLWLSGENGIPKGNEVFNSYGRHGNRHLLLQYGFCLATANPWDHVLIVCGVPDDADLCEKKREVIKTCRLPATTSLFARAVVPEGLIKYFRIMVSDANDIEYVLKSPIGSLNTISAPFSKHHELKALQHATESLDAILHMMPTSESTDMILLRSETMIQRVAAIRYRLGRKRILRLTKRYVKDMATLVQRVMDVGLPDEEFRKLYPHASGKVLDYVHDLPGAQETLSDVFDVLSI